MLWKCKIKYQGEDHYTEEIHYADGPLELDTSKIESSIVERLCYTTSHIYSPFLMEFEDRKYIMPEWILVHPKTTIEDVVWDRPKPKVEEVQTWQFESASNKGEFYKVKKNGDKVTCNCSGFFRAKDRNKGCKHVQQVKQELGL